MSKKPTKVKKIPKPDWCCDEETLTLDGVPYYRWRKMPASWRDLYGLNPHEMFLSALKGPVLPTWVNEKRRRNRTGNS